MVKTNQRRKQDKTRSTQKKMPEPEVQQLHNVGPPVARWRVPTSFSFCTCPLYFAWVFLSYLMPSHFIGIFSLGPCILFYFFRCLTPPLATDEGHTGVSHGSSARQAWHLWHFAGGALRRRWLPVTPRHFAWHGWQAWHLATSTGLSPGRRGTCSHPPSFCVAGVALMALGWVWWRAWSLLVARDAAALCVAL